MGCRKVQAREGAKRMEKVGKKVEKRNHRDFFGI
jgi:hypothetical protein